MSINKIPKKITNEIKYNKITKKLFENFDKAESRNNKISILKKTIYELKKDLEKLEKAKKDRKNVLKECMLSQGFHDNCNKIKDKISKNSCKKSIRFCKGIVSKNEKIKNSDKKHMKNYKKIDKKVVEFKQKAKVSEKIIKDIGTILNRNFKN